MRWLPDSTAILTTMAFGVLLAGCPDDETVDEGTPVPTAVAVDPAFFLHDVACSDSPGSLRSYVATITDQTAGGFVLPSSPPISCAEQVSFRYVVVGHAYTAEVDGYTQRPEELAPLGGESSGSRQMLLFGTTDPATPAWTTVCGQGATQPAPGQPYEGPAIAAANVNRVITFCEELTPHGEASVTAIALDPELALGGLACGEVGSFDVLPQGGLPAYLNVSCDPDSSGAVVYDAGIEPGTSYVFRVEAEVGGVAYGARCEAIAVADLQVTASCEPLSRSGTLDVPLAPVFAGEDPATPCAARVTLEGPSGTILSGPVGCTETVRFAPLEPGTYEVTVSREGDDVPASTCEAEVLPGSVTAAGCL
jgi:hypothetical protein